jgi:5-formyltetrahydrofolate cyclo-ligase
MQTAYSEAKRALRGQTQARVNAMAPAQQTVASQRACALLEKQPVWQNASSILFYAPLPAELDIWPLVARVLGEGKQAALPRFVPEHDGYVACAVRNPEQEITVGRFGIREPVPGCPATALNRLDFILVPGVAFDLQGRRLGRGKGFYDQLLAAVRGTTCGVAFDEQIVGAVPVEPHDISLSCILTPTRWMVF